MRAVLGLIVGLIASIVAAVIAGTIGLATTFSVPPDTDPRDLDRVFAIFAAMGQATWIALAIAWFVSGLVGAWVARMIGRAPWAGWAVALLVALYLGSNAVTLRLPTAMTAAWIFGPLLGGLIGDRLGRGRSAPPAVTTVETGDAPADL